MFFLLQFATLVIVAYSILFVFVHMWPYHPIKLLGQARRNLEIPGTVESQEARNKPGRRLQKVVYINIMQFLTEESEPSLHFN